MNATDNATPRYTSISVLPETQEMLCKMRDADRVSHVSRLHSLVKEAYTDFRRRAAQREAEMREAS